MIRFPKPLRVNVPEIHWGLVGIPRPEERALFLPPSIFGWNAAAGGDRNRTVAQA